MRSLMLLLRKNLSWLFKKKSVFASGEKIVSESYERVHKFANLKHAISGMGGVMC